jgi:hypothetical protein
MILGGGGVQRCLAVPALEQSTHKAPESSSHDGGISRAGCAKHSLGLLVDICTVLEQQLRDFNVVPLCSQVKSGLIFSAELIRISQENGGGCAPGTHAPMALGSAPFSSSSVATCRWFLNEAECSAVQPSLKRERGHMKNMGELRRPSLHLLLRLTDIGTIFQQQLHNLDMVLFGGQG